VVPGAWPRGGAAAGYEPVRTGPAGSSANRARP